MSQLEVEIMDPGFSDHSSLAITFADHTSKRPRPFKFLNYLAEYSNFLKEVDSVWMKHVT